MVAICGQYPDVNMTKELAAPLNGSVTRYYNHDEVWSEILQRLADGESMKSKCADKHLPNTGNIFRWLSMGDDALKDRYARAMELRGQHFGEKVADIAQKVLESEELDANRARVALDALKWSAARLSPKHYGDRIEQNLTGQVELTATLVPITIKK